MKLEIAAAYTLPTNRSRQHSAVQIRADVASQLIVDGRIRMKITSSVLRSCGSGIVFSSSATLICIFRPRFKTKASRHQVPLDAYLMPSYAMRDPAPALLRLTADFLVEKKKKSSKKKKKNLERN